MDVYLTAEAGRFLKGLSVLSQEGQCGFLIGHRRGPRVFIETAIPAGKDCAFSYRQLQEVDRLYGGKTAGFFFLGSGRKARKQILKPFAYGRICLEARFNRGRKLAFKASSVAYDGKFVFSPIQLASFPEERKHEL